MIVIGRQRHLGGFHETDERTVSEGEPWKKRKSSIVVLVDKQMILTGKQRHSSCIYKT